MMGGITRLTVSVAVIMLEITGGAALTYVIPLMLALMTAKFVADGLDRRRASPSSPSPEPSRRRGPNPPPSKRFRGGITDAYIALHGYPHLDQKRDWRFFSTTVRETEHTNVDATTHETHTLFRTITAEKWMTRIDDLVVLPVFKPPIATNGGMKIAYQAYPHTLASIEALLDETVFQEYPVVETREERVVVGMIRRWEMADAIRKAKARFMSTQTPFYFFDNQMPVMFDDQKAVLEFSSGMF
jgi:hypothetical protein